MSVRERMARLADRLFDALRDRRAFTIDDAAAVDGGFDTLRGGRYAVLVTYRRSGEPVPSPVWFAVDERGHVLVKTRHDAGKVKRLRHDRRVLLAPSSSRGRPTGPPIRGVGRILPRDEWPRAEQALAAAYGVGRRLSERALAGPDELAAYIEVAPSG